MSVTYQTQTNRALRKLWQCFDEILLPKLANGLLLAISGGPDSRCLLEAIALWPNRNLGKIAVFSLDHGARSESFFESNFIKMRSNRLGFDSFFEQVHKETKKDEASLREERYEILKKIAKNHGFSSIVTAHHLNDISEGYLLFIAGIGGGSFGEAMQAVSKMENIYILRPFLDLEKSFLMYCLWLINQTNYAMDSLDEARKGQRSYVRHEILPFLHKLTPKIDKRLDFISKKTFQTQKFIKNQVDELINYLDDGQIKINLFSSLPSILVELAIKESLKKVCKNKDLRSGHKMLAKFLKNISQQEGLDQEINLFKVKELKGKEYLLPGAKILAYENFLIIKQL